MHTTVLSLVLVLALHSTPGAQAFTPPVGFRGIPWGTHIRTLPDMVRIEQGKYLDMYTRRGDKLAIGPTPLVSLTYAFFQGQLTGVYITFTGETSLHELKAAMSQQYGTPVRPNRFLDRYIWGRGSDVLMSLSYTAGSDQGRMLYLYEPLNRKLKAAEANAATAAGKDF